MAESLSAERFFVRSRLAQILAGGITISMVVFGQVCAFSTMAGHPVCAGAVELESVASSEEHATDACTSDGCSGEAEGSEGEGHCPSGAAMCCSTWAPPGAELSVPPPTSVRVGWTGLATTVVDEDRAPEVALFRLARPPGPPPEVLLSSSLSRRGPPALS